MTRNLGLGLIFLSTFLVSTPLYADQPIFDEMPRWSGGWGVQFIEEYRLKQDLLRETTPVQDGLSEDAHILHIEGVYTWDKSIRATVKLPVVLHAERKRLDASGAIERQTDRGLGDATIAVPLKSYFNLDGRSGSWTLAPQLTIPLATRDAYNVYNHHFGNGLAAGYETETYDYIIGGSVTGWHYYSERPYTVAGSLSAGLNVRVGDYSGHIKLKNVVKYEGDSSLLWSAGPTVYVRLTDTFHTQAEWKHDLFDRKGGTAPDYGNGDRFRLGLGLVF